QNPQISFQNGSDLNQQFESLQNSLSVQKAESCECSDAFVISNALKNDYYMFDENTLKFLAKFRDKLSEKLVVDVLKSVKSSELGVKFFIWVGRQVGYNHTLGVYDTLLDVMRCDKDRIVDSLLREIRDDDDKEVLGKLLNVLVRKCCRNGSWNAALEELNRLKEFGYKGSRVTYNALVRVFLEADKLDSASLVYREMVDVGHKMDVHTLGSFAYSLCKVGKWREALELVENEKFVKDTKLYTRMIGGLCDGSYFEEAMEFLTRMRCDGCCPNVFTYRTLLCGCLNKGKLGRCKMILSMMLAEGCYPSDKIFISLVHGYCKSGDFKYAYKLLKETRRYCVRPSPVLYNIFIGGICGTEEMPGVEKLELAEMAYGQMLEGGFVLNKVNVSNYAQCLCEAGKFEKAFNVICEMMTKGFVPDTSTYNKVINFMCDASKIEKAFWLFKEMKKNGVVPNVHTYTMLIDSFCKAGLIPQARIWFDEMLTNGCAPNVVTYTALIHAYLKDNKTKDANELFEMMLSCNCSPNVVTITAIIDGHCKIGQTEKALQIYTRMKGEEFPDVNMYFNDKESNNLDPNVVTYGALVDGLCKAHKVDQAVKLLDVMVNEGCEPNSIVYDALIDGLLKDGKVEEAEGVYTRMCENGYNPNIFTYGAMIDRMFKDNRLDLASRVLSNMLKNSCPPNVVIYTEMVDGLCKVGKTDEAYRLMEMMEEKGCKPNVVTYTAMINGFGIAGKVERSLELFKKMGSKSCAPNYVTYRVLINHCCASGLLDEAHGLLEEMKQTYWPKHMGSYRKVIEGYSRDFLSNLGLLEDVSEYDSVPLIPVYKILFDSFRKAGRLEVALELHKEMSLLSSQMDKDLYFSLIESLSVSHRVEKAFELYADMISKGIVPELSVLVNLVKGLVKVDLWEDAMQLSQSLCYMDIQWLPYNDTNENKGYARTLALMISQTLVQMLTLAETILIPFTRALVCCVLSWVDQGPVLLIILCKHIGLCPIYNEARVCPSIVWFQVLCAQQIKDFKEYLVIDILEKLVKSRHALSKAMVARNGVIDSPYGRLA
ncbi:pentatricopeptide repeat-containing protein, partial [Tanacetum coccineum]